MRAKQQDWTTTSLIIESVNKALWMNGPSSAALIGWLRGVKPRLNVFAVYTNKKLGIWSILKVRIGLWIREFKMYLLFYSWHCCYCYYVENRFSYMPILYLFKIGFLCCLYSILFLKPDIKIILIEFNLIIFSSSSYCLPDNLYCVLYSFFFQYADFDGIFFVTGHGFPRDVKKIFYAF